jgi:hypothetical protein
MQQPNNEPAAPEIVPMTDARADELRAELARRIWSVESYGGARRLNERMKISQLRRELRDAGRAEV